MQKKYLSKNRHLPLKKTIFILIAPLLISGCSIFQTNPYISINYFDIGSPDSSSFDGLKNVIILQVRADSHIQEKMIFRTSPISIKMDEFNRWSMPPSSMIQRYMLMLDEKGNETSMSVKKNLFLKGEILQLEADLQNKTVNFSIRFELIDSDKNNSTWAKTFKQEISVQKVTGENFASALQKATNNILKELDSSLKDIQR